LWVIVAFARSMTCANKPNCGFKSTTKNDHTSLWFNLTPKDYLLTKKPEISSNSWLYRGGLHHPRLTGYGSR